MYLFSLDRSVDSILITSLRALDGLGVAPVVCTRPNVFDLAVMKDTGDVTISPCERVPELKIGRALGRVVGMTSHGPDVLCLLTQTKGRATPAAKLWALSNGARDPLVQRCLEAVACAISVDAFAPFHLAFLEQRQSSSVSDDDADLAAFFAVLEHALGVDGAPVPTEASADEVSWQELLTDPSDCRSGDAALRYLSPSARLTSMTRSSSSQLRPKKRMPSTLRFDTASSKAVVEILGLLWADLGCRLQGSEERCRLARMLCDLAGKIGLSDWCDALARSLGEPPLGSTTSPQEALYEPCLMDVTDTYARLIAHGELQCELLQRHPRGLSFFGPLDPIPRLRQLLSILATLFDRWQESPLAVRAVNTVRAMLHFGCAQSVLRDLPLGFALPIKEALRYCQFEAPEDLPATGYRLVGRDDLARQAESRMVSREGRTQLAGHPTTGKLARAGGSNPDATRSGVTALCSSDDAAGTGATARRSTSDASRFSDDMRTLEVAKMLNHTREIRLRLADGSDPRFVTLCTHSTCLWLIRAYRQSAGADTRERRHDRALLSPNDGSALRRGMLHIPDDDGVIGSDTLDQAQRQIGALGLRAAGRSCEARESLVAQVPRRSRYSFEPVGARRNQRKSATVARQTGGLGRASRRLPARSGSEWSSHLDQPHAGVPVPRRQTRDDVHGRSAGPCRKLSRHG